MQVINFANAYAIIGDYNGRKPEVKKLWKYLAAFDKYKPTENVPFPSHILDTDFNDYGRLLWACLVIMYGNYGISPRCGWIEDTHAAKNFVRDLLKEM